MLLGFEYNYTADIWSTACLTFELLTGDYLFDPRGSDEYSRDEDHLAHIVELLGNIPPHIIFQGKYGHKYFNSYGMFRCLMAIFRRFCLILYSLSTFPFSTKHTPI